MGMKHVIAAHLSYPLLDRITKKLLCDFIESDGLLREKFPREFKSADGVRIKINNKKRITNLSILLRSVEILSTDQELEKKTFYSIGSTSNLYILRCMGIS